jgi:hypothetical protein
VLLSCELLRRPRLLCWALGARWRLRLRVRYGHVLASRAAASSVLPGWLLPRLRIACSSAAVLAAP